ncbi:MAG: 50S ribosomal protein L11 methyltransferase [bacterium]
MTCSSTPGLPVLHVARIETTSRLAELYDDQCVEGGDDQCTSWFDVDTNLAVLEYYCATRAEAEHRYSAMTAFLEPHRNGELLAGHVRDMPSEDWSETWKKFFHSMKVSDRIWIKPSWETCAAEASDIIVEIDPGMSFGTGQHGTTRGCLQMIDHLAGQGTCLRLADIGCGSGILAIAAAKLGYRDLVALDHDPDAVRIARENAELNHVSGRIRFMTGDCEACGLTGTHDIVVANILATVLIAHAPVLTGILAHGPEARMILSGILNPQAVDVQAAYETLGLVLSTSLELGEWTTLCLKRLP